MKHIRIFLLWLTTAITSVAMGSSYSLRYYDDSDGLSHWHTSGMIEDESGMIWIATWNGINRFDGTGFTSFKPEVGDGVSMPCDRIRRLKLIDGDTILCLVEDRILAFDIHTCHFDTLPTRREAEFYQEMRLPLKSTYQITPNKTYNVTLGEQTISGIREQFTDRNGNIWLQDSHGFYVATPTEAPDENINHIEARSMYRMQNGDIWYYRRDSRQVLVYDPQLHLKGYLGRDLRIHSNPVDFIHAYAILQTPDGHIWIGQKPGNLLEIADGRIIEHPNTPNVYNICQSGDGTIWCASFAGGLIRIQKDIITHLTRDMFMRRICILNDTMLLAATTEGLLVLDDIHAPHPTIRLHQRDPRRRNSLSSNAVMNMICYNDQLYVATEGGGINLLTNDLRSNELEFRHITAEQGLASDNVFEFMPWNDSTLFVQGNSWLALLNTRSLLPTIFNKSFFTRHLLFGEVPPIPIDSTHLLLASSTGLIRIPIAAFSMPQPPVRVALSSIASKHEVNHAVDYLNHIRLARDERSIVIRFSAVNYNNNRNIRYSTRIYPRGEKPSEWGTPTATNEVVLQDLRPGNYIFEVRATNAYGHWIDNTRRLGIDVTPTFVESTPGRILIAVLLLAAILTITILSLRMQFMRQRRKETLQSYLDLQERLSEIEHQHAEQQTAGQQPLPVPEVLAPSIPSKDELFLNQVRQFMESNMDNSEAVIDDLAEATNMSRSTLNRKMHELFNLSAKDFLQEARIKHACQLLRTTDLAAKEVAFACGFSDPRYFAKCFKASVGQTPTEYRTNED